MKLTAQQTAFLAALMSGTSNLALRARAGCGKTSTIMAGVAQEVKRNPRIEIGVVCFGAAIKDEIEGKIKKAGIDWKCAQAMTTHSMGFGLCKYAFGLTRDSVDDKKVMNIINDLQHEDSAFEQYAPQIAKLVGLAKGDGFGFFGDKQIGDVRAWYALADHYDVNGFDDTTDMDEVISAAQKVYRASLQDTKTVDFGDMVLFPLVKNLRVRYQKDLIFVDEAQDTSPARQALIRKFMKPRTGRIVLVGDDRQAIMGFSGADVDALPNMIRDFNASVFPLSVTWRCPKAVVAEAQRLVPDIEAAETAIDGAVTRVSKLPDDLKVGDAILCRNTAPLISIAYKIIRSGRVAKVEGRSIGEGLEQLAKRWKVKTIDALLNRLSAYEDREVQKALAKGNDSKVEEVEDRVATLKEIIAACIESGRTDAAAVGEFIRTLFADGAENAIILATYHRSKGREWDRVILFEHAERCPSKAAKQDWQLQQEDNLAYVAITRAMKELVYVG